MKLFSYFKVIVLGGTMILGACSISKAQGNVRITGAMRNVMWKGELGGNIATDTLKNEMLFGLGPIEHLRGEILIMNGKTYVSGIRGDSMVIDSNVRVEAPFFVHAEVENWKEIELMSDVHNISDIEQVLDSISKSNHHPFAFKLEGRFHTARIHVVNLPPGTKVKSPDDAHTGQQDFYLEDELAIIIGFFSRKHKSIFTHHDSYLHMHLISNDRSKLGHVDEIQFSRETVRLFVQAD